MCIFVVNTSGCDLPSFCWRCVWRFLVSKSNDRSGSRDSGGSGHCRRQRRDSRASDGIGDPAASTAGSSGVTRCCCNRSPGRMLSILHPTVHLNIITGGVNGVEIVPFGSHPVFVPASEASHETLPACFLLRLQPAIPMVTSLFQKLSQITG